MIQPMQFVIADSFTDSLSRLNGDDQKALRARAFDLKMKPANLGMNFHRLDKARPKTSVPHIHIFENGSPSRKFSIDDQAANSV